MLKAQIIKKRRAMIVDVALELEPGASIGLFGASGTGKSTALACIAGTEDPDEGYVKLGDLQFFPPSLPLHRRPVGYLTQEPGLFPHLTVRDNVCFGIRGRLAASSELASWVETLRDRLQLGRIW